MVMMMVMMATPWATRQARGRAVAVTGDHADGSDADGHAADVSVKTSQDQSCTLGHSLFLLMLTHPYMTGEPLPAQT